MSAVPARDRAALVEELRSASERAATSAGGFSDHDFELAGLGVRLRFAGPAMVSPTVAALAHLAVPSGGDPDLTVRIWDSESTSTAAPVPPWGDDAYREHGTIRGYFGEGLYAVFLWGTRSLCVVDTDNDEAFLWTSSAENLGQPERGAPLRTLFHLWLTEQDVQLVHAAAVGRPDGCLLLVGNSGSGKTSTALSCLPSDLGHLGEDYCLVTDGEPPSVFSLYNSAKVGMESIKRLPFLRELLVEMPDRNTEKALLDLHLHAPGKLLATAPLRAIAIPEIVEREETVARPASSGVALAALAPSTLLQLPGTGERAMARLSALVRSVPCHRLEVGSDPSKIPAAIDSLLASP